MHNKFQDTSFALLYLWMAKAKYIMGILYLAYTLMYLMLGLMAGVSMTLDLFTAIQMLFAAFFIGIAKQAILPKNNLTKLRSALWVASATAISLLFNFIFKWYAPFPAWCFIVFLVASVMGMMALLLSYYLELHQETKALNLHLENFQSKMKEASDSPHL
jgi:hypothetical protein